MLTEFLDMQGRLSRLYYIMSSVFIAGISTGLIYIVYQGLHFNHHLYGLSIFIGIVIAIIGYTVLLTQTIKRLNDMARCGLWSTLVLLPLLNIPLFWFIPVDEILNSSFIAIPVIGLIILLPLYVYPSK